MRTLPSVLALVILSSMLLIQQHHIDIISITASRVMLKISCWSRGIVAADTLIELLFLFCSTARFSDSFISRMRTFIEL